MLAVGTFGVPYVTVEEAAGAEEDAAGADETAEEEADECAVTGTVVAAKLVVTGGMETVLTTVEPPDVSVVTALDMTVL